MCGVNIASVIGNDAADEVFFHFSSSEETAAPHTLSTYKKEEIMSSPRRYQRIEETIAVQYTAGDVEAEQAIRGWANLPVDAPIPVSEGYWVVKRRGDGQLYIVEHEDFIAEFQEVLDNASGD